MAYYSLFQPLTKEERQEWNNKFGFNEIDESYDSRAYINEDEIPNVAPQQPTQTQPQTSQQPNQVQQTPQVNTQQPQSTPAVQPQQPQVIQPQNIINDQTWKAYEQTPTYETLKAFYTKLSAVMQKMDVMFANQNTQQPNQVQQPTQQPQTNPNPQPQSQQTPQPQNSSLKFSSKYKKMNENEEEKKTEEPKSDTESTSSKEVGGKSEIKYDSAMNKDEGGKEHDFGWDKKMKDSIFGTTEDPFQNTEDVKYDDVYGSPMDKPKEREMGIEVTKPEPFKPETPSFTSLSNPKELSKTIFTSGSVKIKDAPTVAKEEEVSGIGNEGKKNDSEKTSSSSKGNEPQKKENTSQKKSEDDGSDGMNEDFDSDYNCFLTESYISDELKKIIIQEFVNTFEGKFDIDIFSDWVSEYYPNLNSNPKAFDEISSEIQNGMGGDGNFNEDLDDDFEDEINIEDNEIDSDEDITLEDIVDEYIEQYEGDEFDEEDAIAWLEDNYETDEESQEDFLDMVASEFDEDVVNESFEDEFFDFEKI